MLYEKSKFQDFNVDETVDPELYGFINYVKNKGPKFANYTAEQLEKFLSRIYELRKDNANNTAG